MQSTARPVRLGLRDNLAQLPPTPPNFVRIVDLNEAGEFPSGDPTDLETVQIDAR